MQTSVRIEKITLNVGAGKEQSRLDKGFLLLKELTGVTPVKTVTQKRIPTWGLRPGLPICAKVTLRGEEAKKMVRRLLHAKDNKLKSTNFDNNGNVAFGVHEYIDIEAAKYNPQIGIMGLEVAVTLEKPGYHIKRRKIKTGVVGKRQRVSKEEAQGFMKETFAVLVE